MLVLPGSLRAQTWEAPAATAQFRKCRTMLQVKLKWEQKVNLSWEAGVEAQESSEQEEGTATEMAGKFLKNTTKRRGGGLKNLNRR